MWVISKADIMAYEPPPGAPLTQAPLALRRDNPVQGRPYTVRVADLVAIMYLVALPLPPSRLRRKAPSSASFGLCTVRRCPGPGPSSPHSSAQLPTCTLPVLAQAAPGSRWSQVPLPLTAGVPMCVCVQCPVCRVNRVCAAGPEHQSPAVCCLLLAASRRSPAEGWKNPSRHGLHRFLNHFSCSVLVLWFTNVFVHGAYRSPASSPPRRHIVLT